jgi:hypothetical protein
MKKYIALNFKGPCPLAPYSQQMCVLVTRNRIFLCLRRSGGRDQKTGKFVRGFSFSPQYR